LKNSTALYAACRTVKPDVPNWRDLADYPYLKMAVREEFTSR
jgi:hypothetical protein